MEIHSQSYPYPYNINNINHKEFVEEQKSYYRSVTLMFVSVISIFSLAFIYVIVNYVNV